MSDTPLPTPLTLTVDGVEIQAMPGQTIIQACDDAGIYIPRLCYRPELAPGGQCRVCSVNVNGRIVGACHTPVVDGMVVDNETPELNQDRQAIIEMLFVSGNHRCPECEKSGDCDLQALAYRLDLLAPTMPYLEPVHGIDATHPDVYIDRDRCILCGLCVRASQTLDGKSVFGFKGRGIDMQLAVNSEEGLGGTELELADAAAHICPVGALVIKREGNRTPWGERRYDRMPIGADIEAKRKVKPAEPLTRSQTGDTRET